MDPKGRPIRPSGPLTTLWASYENSFMNLQPAILRLFRGWQSPPIDSTELRFSERQTSMMAIGTFALGMGIFASLYGLVAACDRL